MREGLTDWPAIIARARELAEHDKAPSLKWLYTTLVKEGALPETQSAYVGLSREIVAARADGAFPALVRHVDRGPLLGEPAVGTMAWRRTKGRVRRPA